MAHSAAFAQSFKLLRNNIEVLEKDDSAIYKHVDKVQNQLTMGLKDISKRHGIPMLIQGPRGVFFALFMEKEIVYSPKDLKGQDIEKQKKFRNLLFEEGITILQRGRWYFSGALTEADVDETIECADRAMAKL